MSPAEHAAAEWVGQWRVLAVGSAEAPERVVATLTLTDDGQVTGRGGVNTFGGTFVRVDDGIEFGPLMATLMAGPEPAARFEEQLFACLAGRCEVRAEGDSLVLGRDATEIRCQRM
jgi:heat shock protein HslJ